MNKLIHIISFFLLLNFLQSCKNNGGDSADEDVAPEDVVSQVTITHPAQSSITEKVELNATSAFLLKTFVTSNAIGYLQSSGIKVGDYVSKGQTLFTIKTKEAAALGNTINNLDTSLHFEGVTKIKSPISGYITQLTYTAGSYVQDGEQLAEITDKSSFAFLLDLPYELKPYLAQNKILLLHLADSTVLDGYVQSALPSVDSAAQTQRYIIKVNTNKLIPENLIAKVELTKQQLNNVTLLPKAAVLSNEEQTQFWIMKLINDSTAVKTDIKKGIENNDSIQIVEPPLNDSDKIVLTGNYGLSDTAKVKVNTK
ncbi:MAG TPA: HlyD family efflux transporter periplasmic adaptor subunit [Parafilimonas sp.]|nr:HlyD family efflux transporter periplasmic adaptor subunit [Parafilimonas sp.]